MPVSKIRDILGIFYLGTTGVLGAYIILFQETMLLPIAAKDATSAFQIIIPTFVAQLTLIFRWIADPPTNHDAATSFPSWAILGPPFLVLLILGATIALLITDAGSQMAGGQIFKNSVTFCVSLLGATSVIIIARVFGSGTD
ncbi:MAG TPA: hypothetical protein VMN38_04550 [Sphingomicrobium sp.]|nr:hypothetical protein [Sphingomicrobium sp.]